MKREITLKNLPIGTGAAIGSFVRSIYLTAASRLAIIGININDLSLVSKLGDNSAMASDLLLMLIAGDYTISENVATERHLVGKTSLGNIYSVTVSGSFSEKITRDDFKNIIQGETIRPVKIISPVQLVITFYIAEVTGIVQENLAASVLKELPLESSHILPCACSGRHLSNCWMTSEQHQFTENITIHVECADAEILEKDCVYIHDICSTYAEILKKALCTL